MSERAERLFLTSATSRGESLGFLRMSVRAPFVKKVLIVEH